MLLGCPWCGLRELEEFRFRSVVTAARGAAASSETTSASAYARVYERENIRHESVEYWQHERGCRAWLVVQSNPSTAEILDVRLLATTGVRET